MSVPKNTKKSKAAFSSISIIFNPNSTGDGKSMAKQLQDELRQKLPDVDCTCVPTKYAGHAIEIARTIAQSQKAPLIVSSSGDGGYNEVVNGVMTAGNPHAVCAVLPAGNANDHSRTMQDRPLAKAIVKGATTKIDLLKVTIKSAASKQNIKYAHSYVGLGLTPVVAVELNRHSLNAFKELFVVMKSFMQYRPFKIKHGGTVFKLDSLLFGNINQMAKVLTLAPQNRPTDGKFEIVSFPSDSKWNLVKRLAKAATSHLENIQSAEKYEFSVIKKIPIQIDGEVMKLPAGSKVKVESAQHALLTVL